MPTPAPSSLVDVAREGFAATLEAAAVVFEYDCVSTESGEFYATVHTETVGSGESVDCVDFQ